MIGMKKIVKPDNVTKAIFTTPPPLSGGIFIYGKIGGGKTVTMLGTAQRYHDNPDRKYKIIDLYGGDRKEQLYWAFPSNEHKYWKKAKKLLKLDAEGPKKYLVHFIYPYYKSNFPKKLPNDPPFVKSSIMTIPIKSIEIEDIQLTIGSTSENDIYVWRESTDALKHKEGPAKFLQYATDLGKTNQVLIRNFINPLCQNQLLQDSYCSTNIDVVKELKNKDEITVLCLDFVPREFQIFVLGYLMRRIQYALDSGKVSTKNIIMMREASEFFRATDDSIVPERYKIFRKQLAHFIRMGRRGMHLFLDAQSPSETRGMVDGSQDLTILCKLTSEGDKESATAQLYKDNLITKRQIQQLSVLEPGQAIFVESGKKAKIRYSLLPRTMFWKPGYGDFYTNVWDKLNGNWKDIRPIKEELDQLFINEETAMRELEQLEELKKEEEEQRKRMLERDAILEKEAKLEEIKQRKQEEREKREDEKLQKQIEKQQARLTAKVLKSPTLNTQPAKQEEFVDDYL